MQEIQVLHTPDTNTQPDTDPDWIAGIGGTAGGRIIDFSRSEITDTLLDPTAPWNSVLERLGRYQDECRLQTGRTAHPLPQRASTATLPADAERVFGDFAPRERRPASPRTGAGPDSRAGSTALRSAARVPPACAAGIMRSTRAHGAGIADHTRVAAVGLCPAVPRTP